MRAEKAEVVRVFQSDVQALLDQETFRQGEAKCVLSEEICSTLPVLSDGDLWLELLSPTCTSWSMRGRELGWVCDSHLPFIFLVCGLPLSRSTYCFGRMRAGARPYLVASPFEGQASVCVYGAFTDRHGLSCIGGTGVGSVFGQRCAYCKGCLVYGCALSIRAADSRSRR